ncbi:MAG: DUF5333 domain-containing protein [Aestuariivita sp.]|nr:DUF5333 domain-containing protein [Aestuariivita sp.]MCY4202708.1 DUF5333 domain-containing protein [Aestuariivita sp.]
MSKLRSMVPAIVLAILSSTNVAAHPPLQEVPEIDEEVFYIAVADVIRKECDRIDARTIRAISRMLEINARARELGYGDTEINEYLDSEDNKERMREKGRELFESRAVNPEKPENLCQMGFEEIKNQTRIGELLRVK